MAVGDAYVFPGLDVFKENSLIKGCCMKTFENFVAKG